MAIFDKNMAVRKSENLITLHPYDLTQPFFRGYSDFGLEFAFEIKWPLDPWLKICPPGGMKQGLIILNSISYQENCIRFVFLPHNGFNVKAEKILKSSRDLIPSPLPSVKIQVMGKDKFALGVKATHF